jgi:hypothetical protein
MLVAASPARAAGDIDTCRNATAEPVGRLAACESVIADEKKPFVRPPLLTWDIRG